MGLFSRKPAAERETFGEAMARASAKNAERKAQLNERNAQRAAKVDLVGQQNELLRIATDRATGDAERATAVAELVELIGQAKADELIGARSRLVRRGWVR